MNSMGKFAYFDHNWTEFCSEMTFQWVIKIYLLLFVPHFLALAMWFQWSFTLLIVIYYGFWLCRIEIIFVCLVNENWLCQQQRCCKTCYRLKCHQPKECAIALSATSRYSSFDCMRSFNCQNLYNNRRSVPIWFRCRHLWIKQMYVSSKKKTDFCNQLY